MCCKWCNNAKATGINKINNMYWKPQSRYHAFKVDALAGGWC